MPMALRDFLHGAFVHPRRVKVLRQRIASLLPAGRSILILDVGCGDGLLARRLAETRPGIRTEGIDVLVRPEAQIPAAPFDGERFPYEDQSVDLVLLVDVLHHASHPLRLLKEARRVARDAIIIKDHLCEKRADRRILRFMDRVGNARHGVALPYNYLSRQQWLDLFGELGLTVTAWESKLRLYPLPADWIFGRSLHFIARLASRANG